jgi:hypothetical protein
MDRKNGANGNGAWHWSYWLLIFVCAVTFLVPFYNRVEPTLLGFPFFYWFQLGWIFVSMIVTAYVYFVTEQHEKSR